MTFMRAIAVVALSAVGLPVQSAQVIEPEYNHVAFRLDATTNALVPLERQRVNLEVQGRAGSGGGNASAVFNGVKSPVRVRGDQALQFVARFDTQSEDPTNLINLDLVQVTRSRREVVLGRGALSGIQTQSASTIRLNCTKYGGHSFKCVPVRALGPGEYVISIQGALDGFLFGID